VVNMALSHFRQTSQQTAQVWHLLGGLTKVRFGPDLSFRDAACHFRPLRYFLTHELFPRGELSPTAELPAAKPEATGGPRGPGPVATALSYTWYRTLSNQILAHFDLFGRLGSVTGLDRPSW